MALSNKLNNVYNAGISLGPDELEYWAITWHETLEGVHCAEIPKPKNLVDGYAMLKYKDMHIAIQNKRTKEFDISYDKDFIIEDFDDCWIITAKHKIISPDKWEFWYRVDREEDFRMPLTTMVRE